MRGKAPETPDARILGWLDGKAERPVTVGEICAGLNAQKTERRSISRAVRALTATGDLIRITGGRYARPARIQLVTGPIRVLWDGRGVVRAAAGGPTVGVPAACLAGAMDGD